ncbi:hypothetical protein BEU71_001854 [Salmonella enterica subsp. enterica serovar Duval]|nr:hypothetical protein [Salmonella enterica subsp. enterica serovar Johannesburg]EED9559073.1 hypothetical protein [Salmonella enterica subsp. enterica serovar Duval]
MRGLLVALCCGFSHYHIHPISPDMILAITIITKVIITTLTGGIIHYPATAVLVVASSG